MTYDWISALVYVGSLIAMTMMGTFIAFKIPALVEMRERNRVADKEKMSVKRFREAVKASNSTGMWTNLVFYAAILPFCVNLESRPLWRHLVDIVAILFVFDFMYYLTHRFLFHGQILRKVHALHHQSRTPTYIDALYVHPLETFIGLALFLMSIPIVGAFGGSQVHALSASIATLIFTQHNTINHVYTDLPQFPFRVINYITGVHASHHIDMNHGNYSTMTMAYDMLFGTYEKPTHRPNA